MKRVIALLLCVVLVAPGCATSHGPRAQTAPQVLAHPDDSAVLGDFARQIPIGSRIRATTVGHRTIRGTLVKRTERALVIQPHVRVAEPPVEVPFNTLLALEQEVPSSGTGRAVAIGVGVGVGAALGILFLLAALLGD